MLSADKLWGIGKVLLVRYKNKWDDVVGAGAFK